MTTICGRTWKFDDSIDTDVIIPARYLTLPLEEMKQKAMEPVRPGFSGLVGSGDVIVAGRNFGCGSSREQAPAVLKALGISAIVAGSFARIFFRNAINLGLAVVECSEIHGNVSEGERIEIELSSGRIHLPEQSLDYTGSRLPDFLLDVIEAGGLVPHLKTNTGSSV